MAQSANSPAPIWEGVLHEDDEAINNEAYRHYNSEQVNGPGSC